MTIDGKANVALENYPAVSTMEYVVIAGYLLFIVILGVFFAKFNKNTGDYFRSGSQGSWWLCGTNMYIASISAYTFTAAAGVGYYAGWSVMLNYFSGVVVQVLVFFFYAARCRQKRLTTPGEVFRERFNPATQQTYSVVGLVTGLISGGMMLYTLAIFISSIFGFNIQMIIFAVGAVVVCYCVVGGRWAVLATDFLQCLILFAMAILVAILCLREIGGLDGFFESIRKLGLSGDFQPVKPENHFADVAAYRGYFTWKWWLALFLVQLLTAFNVGVVNYSVKDGGEARKSMLLVVALGIGGLFFFFVPAMTARILYSTDVETLTRLAKPGDGAYAIACLKLLPQGMIGMIVVAMFAAAMSSMDSALNSGAGVFMLNIYPALTRFLKLKEMAPEKLLLISKIYCLFAGVVSIGIAVWFAEAKANPLKMVLEISALLALPMTIPMAWGLFLKRVPQWTPIVAMAAGFAAAAVIHIQKTILNIEWHYHEQVWCVFLITSAVVLLSLLWVRRNADEYNRRTDAFFRRMNTPVDFAREVGRSNDWLQLTILGGSSLAGGFFIMCLAIMAGDLKGVLCPVGVGGAIMLVGGLMMYAARRAKQNISEK